jgi:hypothetical protein
VHHGASGDGHAVVHDVTGDVAAEHAIGAAPADRLVDRGPQQGGIGTDGVQQRWAGQQRRQRDPHLFPGGARARGEQQVGEGVDLVVGEPMRAVLVVYLGLNEDADEVVLGLLAPGGDDRIDQAVIRVAESGLRSAHCVTDVEGVLDTDAEAAGDGKDRDRGAKVDVQLAVPVALESVDQAVDGGVDLVLDLAFAGTKERCTSDRYRRCSAPVIRRMLLSSPGLPRLATSGSGDDENASGSRRARWHAS